VLTLPASIRRMTMHLPGKVRAGDRAHCNRVSVGKSGLALVKFGRVDFALGVAFLEHRQGTAFRLCGTRHRAKATEVAHQVDDTNDNADQNENHENRAGHWPVWQPV